MKSIHLLFILVSSRSRNISKWELIDLQCNNELTEHIFESSKSKIDFHNIIMRKGQFSNSRNLAQKVASAFGPTYTCGSFFFFLFFQGMKFAKDKSRSNGRKPVKHRLRCAITSVDIDSQKLSGRVEEQVNKNYPCLTSHNENSLRLFSLIDTPKCSFRWDLKYVI